MPFLIARTESVVKVMEELEQKDERKFRKVRKTLGLLSQDPKHPGLNSHKREAEKGPNGEDIWESYVENNTPGAWRVFWYYGPESGTITVFAITPHP
ncbi:MAG TPA: hypothetical protein VFA07_00825 [Chthonomonadaceae bacterium]|nr:hypothetical protein [Chthonomonadaceae bacterium]